MAERPTRTTTHSGKMLREEFLKPLKLSANAPAAKLHVPANRISAIVKGARVNLFRITPSLNC